MQQSHNEPDDRFMTINQDYGSFYSGRLQNRRTNPDEIALELTRNEQIRNERRQLPSIAYNIMFDVCLKNLLNFSFFVADCFSYRQLMKSSKRNVVIFSFSHDQYFRIVSHCKKISEVTFDR